MPWYFAALADACYKSACLPSEKGSAGAAAPCDLIKRGQTEGQSDGTRVPGAGALFLGRTRPPAARLGWRRLAVRRIRTTRHAQEASNSQ